MLFAMDITKVKGTSFALLCACEEVAFTHEVASCKEKFMSKR